jgi:hypothetical protein
MANSVRDHFEARADGLKDCATLHIVQVMGGDEIRLVPHNPDALGVRLHDDNDGEFEIWFDRDAGGGEETSEPEHADFYIDAAVTGQVRRLDGPGRSSLQVDSGDGYRTIDSQYDLSSLFPIPGWRKRAKVTQFAPYRTQ